MAWSKVRHSVDYDPKTANFYEDADDAGSNMTNMEEEDLKLRPTLIHTLTKSLSDFLFRTMLSSAQNDLLDLDEVRNVMAYRNDDSDPFQLTPKCWRGKADPDDDSREVDSSKDENGENDEHCEVSFLYLYQHYGFAYRLRLSLQKSLMNISSEEARKRQTPDQRGWTKPIHDTNMYVNVLIYTPDYSEEDASRARLTNKLVGQKQQTKKDEKKKKQFNNQISTSRVDDLLTQFLRKANTVLQSYMTGPIEESPLSTTPLANPLPLPTYVDTSSGQYQHDLKQTLEKQRHENEILSNPYCVEYQITQVEDCLKLIDYIQEEMRKEEEALQKAKEAKERQKQIDLSKDNQHTSGWGSTNYYGADMKVEEEELLMMEALTRESLEEFERNQHDLEQQEQFDLALEEEFMEEEIMRSDVDNIDPYEQMIQEVILQRRREEEEKKERRSSTMDMSEEEEIMLGLEEEERLMMEELRLEQQRQQQQRSNEEL
eukprot:CAMPEP_0185738296 /NCGR_PEP_ID=MMETSP1171-20130828/32492_1 /TAXON_ID=374046 /ORGANISM="Helicotheca tamensis, Strain CCMP826" /LENGTH=486 /DNA_ID=CAMNT_0028409467 /DNA_START=84 /DNA_END=1544 /DNA_ORIENTATION=+